jgi:pyruvate dehydrogenase E2 component (dihydrolipoamide acetyltransferase)
MATEIVVPRLGWSMDEGTFVEWLKADGEIVNAGDMLFVLEGEKAAQDVESFDAGILHIPVEAPQAGDTVLVSQVLGFLLEEGETPPEYKLAETPVSPAVDEPAMTTPRNETDANSPIAKSKRRNIASPRARRKATELGIRLDRISGTGRNGRIRERDIIAAVENGVVQPAGTASSAIIAPTQSGTLKPLTNVRRITAQRMQASAQQTVPVTLNTKFNAKGLIAYRDSLKTSATTPSYNDIIMKLAANLLRECPELNACWTADGVYVYDQINIAFAVDTDNGLLAPVINQVDKLMLDDVVEYSTELIQDARAGRLGEAQLTGGTFTISSLGTLGVDNFTPVINLPQAGILGIGRIVAEPLVEAGEVIAGHTMSLSLTFDHQVLDGAPAAGWLQKLAHALTSPKEYIS